jgi:hypothetical protein
VSKLTGWTDNYEYEAGDYGAGTVVIVRNYAFDRAAGLKWANCLCRSIGIWRWLAGGGGGGGGEKGGEGGGGGRGDTMHHHPQRLLRPAHARDRAGLQNYHDMKWGPRSLECVQVARRRGRGAHAHVACASDGEQHGSCGRQAVRDADNWHQPHPQAAGSWRGQGSFLPASTLHSHSTAGAYA